MKPNESKIIGSGSAGNHIANAFSKLPVNIVQTDFDLPSLNRSKFKIYIKRYKSSLEILHNKSKIEDNQFYDAIIISTLPHLI